MARLDEIFDLQMGKTPARANSDYWVDGTNSWVSIADLSRYEKYVENTKEQITDKAIQESGIKIVPTNTVIMSFKLSLGKTAITKEAVYTNEAIMAFIPNGKYNISPEYFFYMLSGKDWSKGTNRAVMGVILNKTTLGEIDVAVPPIKEQQYVASVLDKLTALISLRKQQLDKLDELVKARFVEMFGDPEYNNRNLPIYKLSDLCEVGSSKRIYQYEQSSDGVPFLRVSDLVNRIDKGIESCELFIPNDKYEELCFQKLVPYQGDILVTSRGTLGKCYVVKSDDRFYFQDGMISWLSNFDERIINVYISCLFSMPGFQKQITSLQSGSTVAYLSISMLKKLNIMLPDLQLQQQFYDFLGQVNLFKLTIQQSLDKLEVLRKSLMQAYFG